MNKIEHRKRDNQRKKDWNEKCRKLWPWKLTYKGIQHRCRRNSRNDRVYRKRKLKTFLTVDNLKYLWFRDKAYLLKQPSIDRINPLKDYTLQNCRYIEMRENMLKDNVFYSKNKREIKCPHCNKLFDFSFSAIKVTYIKNL